METIVALVLLAPFVFGLTVTALAVAINVSRHIAAATAAPPAEPKLESPAWVAPAQSRSSVLTPSPALATFSSSRSSLAG